MTQKTSAETTTHPPNNFLIDSPPAIPTCVANNLNRETISLYSPILMHDQTSNAMMNLSSYASLENAAPVNNNHPAQIV